MADERTGIKYIGKDKTYKDRMFGTGLVWQKGETLPINVDLAKEFLKHPSLFSEVPGFSYLSSTTSDGGVVGVQPASFVAYMQSQIPGGSGPIITVTADKTGVIDATDAIQAAIDSLPLNAADVGIQSPLGFANGGAVFLPKGRYKITRTINLRRGITLYGESRESTQLVSYVSGSVLKYYDAGRYIQDEINIRDLSIWQHDSVPATSGAGIELVDNPAMAMRSLSCGIHNVIIHKCYVGIRISAGVGGCVQNCNIMLSVWHGVELPWADGVYQMTTSMSFINVYSQQSQTGSGFYMAHATYVHCIGTSSDSNYRYGYETDAGGNLDFRGGAEENRLGGLYIGNTYAVSIYVDIFDNPSGTADAITLNQAFGVKIGGLHHGIAGSTGYSIKIIASGDPVVICGLERTLGWITNFCNSEAQLLQLGYVSNGFLGGVGKRWAFGASSYPSQTVQLEIGGTSDANVTTGLLADNSFQTAGTSNATVAVQVKTENTAVTYALAIAAYVKAAAKGAASTITRLAGLAIEDQTAGGTANANLMLGGAQPPAGTWNIYSQSTRESVWCGGFRFVSSTGPVQKFGAGAPEGAITAAVGSLYLRTDGGAGSTLYVKESGAGNTGWVAK